MDTQTLDAATVDSFMGSGWFNGYTKVAEEDFLFEQERAMENIKRFAAIWHAGTRLNLNTTSSVWNSCRMTSSSPCWTPGDWLGRETFSSESDCTENRSPL